MIPKVLNFLLDVGKITEVQPFQGGFIRCDQTIIYNREVLRSVVPVVITIIILSGTPRRIQLTLGIDIAECALHLPYLIFGL